MTILLDAGVAGLVRFVVRNAGELSNVDGTDAVRVCAHVLEEGNGPLSRSFPACTTDRARGQSAGPRVRRPRRPRHRRLVQRSPIAPCSRARTASTNAVLRQAHQCCQPIPGGESTWWLKRWSRDKPARVADSLWLQEREHCTDTAMLIGILDQPELVEDAFDMSLDRPLGDEDLIRNRAVRHSFGHE